MIVVQLVTLSVFFGLVLVPLFVLPAISGARDFHPLDPAVVEEIAHALEQQADGSLRPMPTAGLKKISSDYPAFWFMAVSSDGSETRYGDIPPEADALRPAIADVVSMQVMIEREVKGQSLLVRTLDLSGVQVKVLTGQGPTLALAEFLQKFSLSLMAMTFLVLATASGVAIPRFIRRELRGLHAAASAAETIDVDQRGIRIPESGLPAEVLTLVNAVNSALARLDEAHSRRERFLADAAHELRTPIAVLSARIETAEAFEGRERLLQDVIRLGDLTNQLLDAQRFTLREVQFSTVDLSELAVVVVSNLAPLAIAAGYGLELHAPNPVVVLGDAESLQRAVTNVVRNAIAHGGNRGRIVVSVAEPGTISVCDDGPGVPLQDRDRIFEPFHRAAPSSEGAGLGLSLVLSIVSRHRATITVGSSATGGARFDIRFAQ